MTLLKIWNRSKKVRWNLENVVLIPYFQKYPSVRSIVSFYGSTTFLVNIEKVSSIELTFKLILLEFNSLIDEIKDEASVIFFDKRFIQEKKLEILSSREDAWMMKVVFQRLNYFLESSICLIAVPQINNLKHLKVMNRVT